MTTETITIVVNEKGARVVKRSIEDVGKGAQQAQKGVSALKKALAGVAGVVTVTAFSRLVDTYTNLQNRLRLVTKGTRELKNTTQALFDISNSTRSSYEATTEVFARTALAVQELGLSQQQTLAFTKSLNQAVILSGASSQEAQAGLIQLSQGLASGTLRGDELRSVLEQLPSVADVIAKSLGVTRGKLRELGTDGKITAGIILKAFAEARGELEGKFAKTVPTVGQAIVTLRNNLIKLLGGFDQATGISKTVAQTIISLGNNIETLAKLLVVAAAAWVGYSVAANGAAIASITGLVLGNAKAFIQLALSIRSGAQAMALFNLVANLNPFVLLGTLIGATIAAVVLFKKEILDLGRKIEFFGTNVTEVFAFVADVVVGTFGGAYAVVAGFFNKIRVLLVQNAEILNKFLEPFGREIDIGKIIGSDMLAVMKSAGQSMGENFNAGFKKATENGFLARELGGAITRGVSGGDTDFSGGGANLDTLGASEDATKKLKEKNVELERQKQLLTDIYGPSLDYLVAIEDLTNLYEGGLIGLQDYNNALANQEEQFLANFEATNFADGFVSQIRRMQLETRNATATMGTDLANIFGPGGTLTKGIGDAAAQILVFGKSGKEQIRQLAQSILSSLVSSLVQVGVTMLINATLGNAVMTAATAASTTAAAATAAAWSPAAAAVSLASFGANSAPAAAGIASTYALSKTLASSGGGLPGFEAGGYTGNYGTKQVAGLVHGQEFVTNAAATARNRSTLEAMNRGETINSDGGGMKVTIINEIPDAEFTANQISPSEVELIAKRVVREDAPSVIAGDLGNSNSKTSKALTQNTTTTRRRL